MNNIDTEAKIQESFQQELGSFIWDSLKSAKYEEAVSEIKKEKYHQYLIHNSLDIVPVILKVLIEGTDLDGEKCVEDLLVHIASVANSKEALLAFLEELEINRSEKYFRVLLAPLQTLLLRQVTEKTRPTLFSWVFNTLYSHVALMELPKNYSLEGKERKLLDLHPDVQALTRTLRWLCDFYVVFYHKVIKGELVWGGKVKNSKEFLAYFLLQLFHKPITFLDVYCVEGEVENSLFRVCNELSGMIAHLLGNTFKLFDSVSWNWSKTVLATDDSNEGGKNESSIGDQGVEMNDNPEDDDVEMSDKCDEEEERKDLSETNDKSEESKDMVSQLSLACYFYCILDQNMAGDFIPCVYSQQYVFLSCLPLIAHLLEEKDDLAIHKGLMLSKSLLAKLSVKSLTRECLEAKAHSSFPQLLIRIMTFSNNEELRKTALDVFRPYLRKFERPGRRNLIKGLLQSVKHAGVLGLVIHELKENIAECLNEEVMDPSFSGSNVDQLILLACTLPDGETTDLLEWSDRIMPALNMLVFLFVRDKEDRTGVTKLLPSLERDFFSSLQKGLELSRAHYELKLREVSMSNKKKGAEVSVNVGGMTLPNIPPDQEKKIIQTALCSFDMMQCVLARAIQASSKKM